MTSAAENSESISFRVTAEMIAAFSDLTGDRSSLHTNEAFARRTQYRQTIAHGFLPLLFLAALPALQNHRIKRLNANFLKPVFPGSTLKLTLTYEALSSEREFSVSEISNGAVVTAGFLELESSAESNPETANPQSPSSLLFRPLEESNLTFDQINPGDEATFEFQLNVNLHHALVKLLNLGSAIPTPNISAETSAPLLAASLFSTLIGMRLPGRAATFLNFDVAFTKPLVWAKSYRYRSVVDFKSPTTQTMSQNVSISDASDGTPHASGKAHARVNPPPSVMPTMSQLKADALDLNLRGKVVLITGASRGLGETAAKLFALHGAKVAVNYLRSESEAARVVDEIVKAGGEAFAVQADVTDRDQVRAMVQGIVQHFGPVDVLVNNAVRDFQPAPFLELTWDRVAQDLDVVVKGAFNCCQEVLPGMVARRAGKIVNLSTVAVEMPPANQSKYVLAKSALVGLTRSLAVEFAPHNIHVNLVVPGLVETDLTQHLGKIATDRVKQETPMQRLATPVDVARAMVFLASSLSSFTTGQKIPVTGGAPPLF